MFFFVYIAEEVTDHTKCTEFDQYRRFRLCGELSAFLELSISETTSMLIFVSEVKVKKNNAVAVKQVGIVILQQETKGKITSYCHLC